MSEFEDIQRLLRLKRYENPGPNHVEETLARFHRRQTAELIHRPLWRLALDRVSVRLAPVFSGSPQLGMAYGTAALVACIAAVALLAPRVQNLAPVAGQSTPASESRMRLENSGLQPQPAGLVSTNSPQLAVNPAASPELQALQLLSRGSASSGLSNDGRLNDDFNERLFPSGNRAATSLAIRRTDSPRYVIDTRPVSYDASLSF